MHGKFHLGYGLIVSMAALVQAAVQLSRHANPGFSGSKALGEDGMDFDHREVFRLRLLPYMGRAHDHSINQCIVSFNFSLLGII